MEKIIILFQFYLNIINLFFYLITKMGKKYPFSQNLPLNFYKFPIKLNPIN